MNARSFRSLWLGCVLLGVTAGLAVGACGASDGEADPTTAPSVDIVTDDAGSASTESSTTGSVTATTPTTAFSSTTSTTPNPDEAESVMGSLTEEAQDDLEAAIQGLEWLAELRGQTDCCTVEADEAMRRLIRAVDIRSESAVQADCARFDADVADADARAMWGMGLLDALQWADVIDATAEVVAESPEVSTEDLVVNAQPGPGRTPSVDSRPPGVSDQEFIAASDLDPDVLEVFAAFRFFVEQPKRLDVERYADLFLEYLAACELGK